MIDLHCHFLPGIDDGPNRMEEAIELAKTAVLNGISRSILTPHIHPDRYENDRNSIRRAFERFSEELKVRNIPLELSFAAEVRIGPEIVQLIEEEKIPFLGRMGECDLLLLEFPHGYIPIGSEKFVKWLLSRKIRPMIAHPERNKDVLRNSEKILPFVEMGCLLQLTAGSVAGHFGPHSKKLAVELLERNLVFALATDAHNLDHRPPDLESGKLAAERVIGISAAAKLVLDNPASVSNG